MLKKFYTVLLSLFIAHCLWFMAQGFAQQNSDDIEVSLDVSAATTPLPKIFGPNIDLSGRGLHREATWPQEIAAREALDAWEKDIGFSGFYRLQYNLWDINQFSKNYSLQKKLLDNYEDIIKTVSNSGGTVILEIFGTPAGLGKALDKKSPPWDLGAFKELVKDVIRELSCNKKYNIWYEVWNAPDLDDFFLGRKQEYLNLYRAIAEAIKELEAETKMHIPLGGPSVSWWFQDIDGNTIITPEKGLIYDLIKFCYHYRLPLDFISWHAYANTPAIDKESTIYKKSAVKLIRDWLGYFRFDRNTPLIIDEWNYDRDTNLLAERKEKAYIAATYIPARLKNMVEAGIDYQVYFCLEDFQNNREGIVRNVGAFSFDSEASDYKGGPKSIYNVFKMLARLGKERFAIKADDEFAGLIATKAKDEIILLAYNYIDPDIARNYLSRNISDLNSAERKALLNFAKSGNLEKILLGQLDIANLRLGKHLQSVLNKARELNERAKKFLSVGRQIKLGIKNLKSDYLYQRYIVDSSCVYNCAFSPVEEKEISAPDLYQEILTLSPYAVEMIVLQKKPPPPPPQPPSVVAPAPALEENKGNVNAR